MYIIHVTPLTKNGIEQLSYFSVDDITEGSLISVPIRKRNVLALVQKSESAREIKSILRTNLYETKKISNPNPILAFSRAYIRGAQLSADYFATSIGSIIRASVPTAILDALENGLLQSPVHEYTNDNTHTFEKCALQLPTTDRIEKYKILIRNRFTKKQSVFLCVPNIQDTQYFASKCRNGIEQYTYVLDSSLSKKKQQTLWDSILLQKHPVLIIATPLFASIPREDIALFIIENEPSSSYKQLSRPYADSRILIEHTAKMMNATLIYAGTTLSLHVHKSIKEGLVNILEETVINLRTKSKSTLINTTICRALDKEEKREFPVLSDDVMNELANANERGKLSFVFAARRGIASHTVCNDCDTQVICTQCSAPMILHEMRASRTLLCHRCGSSRDANETCRMCGGWNLVPLGIGIEKVAHYISTHIPHIPLYILSVDIANTPKKARSIIKEFYATSGAVLLGTEMAINYLNTPIEVSVMASSDSLLSIPDFRIEEKIFGIIAKLQEITTNHVLIEARDPDTPMLMCARDGAVAKYVKHELSLRKKLLYPPYTRLIKVTCTGNRLKVIDMVKKFIAISASYHPRVFAGFIKTGQSMTLSVLIRIPTNKWPDEQLVHILRALPPQYRVDIDPGKML